MNRRTSVKALLAAPVLAIPKVVSARQNEVLRCVFMEEREGAFVLEGSGQRLTEPFEMQAGRYRIEVDLANPSRSDIGVLIDFHQRSGGDRVDRFGVSDSEGVPEFASGMVDFHEDGEYLAEISLYRGDWKIVLSPI